MFCDSGIKLNAWSLCAFGLERGESSCRKQIVESSLLLFEEAAG